MPGTPLPYAYQQFGDSNLNPAAGHLLFTYTAGTTTKSTTYSDYDLVVPNTNPITLDSAGAATIYCVPGTVLTLVLATPTDTDPPTSPIWTRAYVPAVPLTASSPDVTGTIADTATQNQAVYLSDGTGGRIAGEWYLTDATTAAYSSTAAAVGFLLGNVTAGDSQTIRLLGRVTGLSSLSVGTVYYLDTTPGNLTSSAPANTRIAGIADTTTSLVVSQWSGVPLATATVSGIVSTASQTMAGDKTWTGFLLSAGSVKSSSASAGVGYATGAGGTQSQGTSKATAVTLNKTCGEITMHNATLNAGVTVSFTLNNTSIAAKDVIVVNIMSGATADSYVCGVQARAANSCSIFLRNTTAATNLSEAVVIGFAIVKAVTS